MIKDKDGDTVKFQKVCINGKEIYVAIYTEYTVRNGILFALASMGNTIGFGETVGKALANAYLQKHTEMKLAENILSEKFSKRTEEKYGTK